MACSLSPAPLPYRVAAKRGSVCDMKASQNTTDSLLTVSDLTLQLKTVIEAGFPRVSVVGELSNCRPASSGHVYLTLKDSGAQLSGVIWRSRASRLKFDLQDGLEVVATGAVEVYAPRGSYQLIIDRIVPQGVGALELAFRQMKEKLEAEGLFNPAHKQPLPSIPKRIAIITSPTSAAVRDMLQVITRRWKAVDIVILPVAVQGDAAAGQIAAAIQTVPEIPDVDVAIVGRGGGSLEDLWAFNEEVVARAIFNCPIPVISAVGHEIDVSISDLVADRRALTPSEAGEIVVPDRTELRGRVDALRHRLCTGLKRKAERLRERLDVVASRRVFTRPLESLHDRTRRLDELADRLQRAAKRDVENRRHRLTKIAGALDALSPLKVLGRGYSVTTRADGGVVNSTSQVQVDDEITTRVSDGLVVSQVRETKAERR